MNPLDWAAIQRLRGLDPNHQNNSSVNNGFENPSIYDNNQNTYCEYSRNTVDELQSRAGGNAEWSESCPATHSFQKSEVQDPDDPDGVPLVEEEEDPELARKWKELTAIEDRIKVKKVSIALNKVELFAKKASLGFACDEESDQSKGPSLRDRVNAILQQRHPALLMKDQSRLLRLNSSSLSKKRLLQDNHPMKLRVKALMKQRFTFPLVSPTHREIPGVTPPLPSQTDTSADKEQSMTDLGFQRFLSVLNKGVDMDMLSRIISADGENLPLEEEHMNIQSAALENKSEPQCESHSGAFLPDCSQMSSREGRSNLFNKERSLSERLSQTREGDNSGGERFASSSRSKSPPPVKSKKKNEKEPQKLDEHQGHLQNILKTLGLSLEVEEMSKLADRTQERLYGKKREDSREEPERGSQKHDMHSSPASRSSSSSRSSSPSSSSTSSFSSSSYSGSASSSPSPSLRRPSKGRDSKQRQTSESSRWKDRSTDQLYKHDRKHDSQEAQRGKDKTAFIENLTHYEHRYSHQSVPTYPPSQAAGYPAFLGHSSPQYSQNNIYNNSTYIALSNSYWMYHQAAQTPAYDPSEYPKPQVPFYQVYNPLAAPKNEHCSKHFEDINLHMNPDLSISEGQMGTAFGRHCLEVFPTNQTNQNCVRTQSECQKKKKVRSKGHSRRERARRKRRKAEKRLEIKASLKKMIHGVS